jgi:hypothetical protein
MLKIDTTKRQLEFKENFMSTFRNVMVCLTLVLLMGSLQISAAEELHALGCIPDKVLPSWVLPSPPIESINGYDSEIDLSSHFPPVGNQGGQGSCTAWGTTYYLKTYEEWVEHGWDLNDLNHRFSPAFTYNMINGGNDGGSGPSDAFKLMCDLGAAPYINMPYTDQNCTNFPSEEAFYKAIPFRAQQAYSINMQSNMQSLKNLLLSGHVAVFAFAVYSNFDNISNYDNTYTLNELYGGERGWHCTCFCGFDDNKVTADGVGAFKVANSWGGSWGANGYFWISYQFLQNSQVADPNAEYVTDRIGYQPTVVGIVHVSHNDRYAIVHKYGIGSVSNPIWSFQTFDWGWQTTPRPYPNSNFIVDLTDGAQYLSPTQQNPVFMQCRDVRNNGITGSITDFAVANLSWPSYAASTTVPVVIPDNGSFVTSNLQISQGSSTPVNGNVSGTWSAAQSPYYVMGDITVPPGSSLTIQPGTNIVLFDNFKLTVSENATLTAVGTGPQPITMAPLISAIGWNGIRFEGASNQSRLEFCNLTSGKAKEAGTDGYGGTIFCSNSSPTIIHCTFESSAATKGGVIACVNSQPQIIENNFLNSTADEVGGAIYCENSTADISGNNFTGNHAANGGAVYTYLANTIIQNNTFGQNTASGYGGAIAAYGGSPDFHDNHFTENQAAQGGAVSSDSSSARIADNTIQSNTATQGGAIYWKQGNLTVIGNEIMQNTASTGGAIYTQLSKGSIENNLIHQNSASNGGAVYIFQAKTTIKANQILNNTAVGFGAGVYILLSNVSLENNLIAHNTANVGTGVFMTYSDLLAKNNTISDNIAGSIGGAISLAYSSRLIAMNCILYGNQPDQINLESGSSSQVVYCDVQGGWNGTGNINSSPSFVGSDDYHLQTSSSCIGAGINSIHYHGRIIDVPNVDIEGNPRPSPTLTNADMGAYENGAAIPTDVLPEAPSTIPVAYKLYQNSPNPFNPSTTLRFDLPVGSHVNLQIFDISGRLVETLVNGQREAGQHEVTFDASKLASGMYLYRISAGEYQASGKMVLVK